jgi:hypothetical protein
VTNFHRRFGTALLALTLVGFASIRPCFAQAQVTTPAKRTVLQQAEVAGMPAQETIFGKVEISPGSGNPFHTHYGTEMGTFLLVISGWT